MFNLYTNPVPNYTHFPHFDSRKARSTCYLDKDFFLNIWGILKFQRQVRKEIVDSCAPMYTFLTVVLNTVNWSKYCYIVFGYL